MKDQERAARLAMPQVDRVAASRASVEARQMRAEVKHRLRSGDVSPLRVLADAADSQNPASTLRVTEFLQTFPGVGEIGAQRILEELEISERKRLGGLGRMQRARLEIFVRERIGVTRRDSRPPLTVLAGPTAVGKGTVANYIREHYPEVHLSISATTRPPRPGEIDGVHYFFVNDEQFDRMLAAGELLEWAKVHNAYRYGTPRQPVLEAAENDALVLLEIDLQGARQVRANMPDARLVFLTPPSWDDLVHRLIGRGTESEEEQARRLTTAKVELAAADEFDEIVVNDVVSRAAMRLIDIMRG